MPSTSQEGPSWSQVPVSVPKPAAFGCSWPESWHKPLVPSIHGVCGVQQKEGITFPVEEDAFGLAVTNPGGKLRGGCCRV